jgi:hypothetical protein
LKTLVKLVNGYTFERIENDISYEEFNKLTDINNALRIESPGKNQITNKGLLLGLNTNDLLFAMKYPESMTRYDPFKKRVV